MKKLHIRIMLSEGLTDVSTVLDIVDEIWNEEEAAGRLDPKLYHEVRRLVSIAFYNIRLKASVYIREHWSGKIKDNSSVPHIEVSISTTSHALMVNSIRVYCDKCLPKGPIFPYYKPNCRYHKKIDRELEDSDIARDIYISVTSRTKLPTLRKNYDYIKRLINIVIEDMKKKIEARYQPDLISAPEVTAWPLYTDTYNLKEAWDEKEIARIGKEIRKTVKEMIPGIRKLMSSKKRRVDVNSAALKGQGKCVKHQH